MASGQPARCIVGSLWAILRISSALSGSTASPRELSRLEDQQGRDAAQQEADDDRRAGFERWHAERMAGVDADRRRRQAEQGGSIFGHPGVERRILAGAERAPERRTGDALPELAQGDHEARALEQRRAAEDREAPARVLERLRVDQVEHTFVGRDAAAEPKMSTATIRLQK
jgi:hypothetical protein